MSWDFTCPKNWEIIGSWGDTSIALREINGGIRVLIDCEQKVDGNHWIHVSYSRNHWTPTHEDTIKVKDAFIGNKYAYSIFPPKENYVNIHKHCLHLWARLDGQAVLPEFSVEIDGFGRSI